MNAMFVYDRGLKLLKADMAVDFTRRQPRGFVSHAHADHIARHELAFCTPATARLYEHRLGKRPVKEMPYREPLAWGGIELTTFPAGHCLGSAMLLAQDDQQRLLYTGDFKLGASLTSEEAELPQADILVMESTFGNPYYRLPPRGVVIDQLCTLIREALDEGAVPLVEAYALGKSQEVSRILSDAGFPVLQHREVFAVSEVYRKCGVHLGDVQQFTGRILPGHVIVAPPRTMRAFRLPASTRVVSFAVTGWAIHPSTKFRLRVEHAIPLSDHADYDELLETVERVSPKKVYCTHGPVSFVDCLRAAGWDAEALEPAAQAKLRERTTQRELFP
jgi:Cft2 family RNA processing exonuclease